MIQKDIIKYMMVNWSNNKSVFKNKEADDEFFKIRIGSKNKIIKNLNISGTGNIIKSEKYDDLKNIFNYNILYYEMLQQNRMNRNEFNYNLLLFNNQSIRDGLVIDLAYKMDEKLYNQKELIDYEIKNKVT